MKNDVAASAKRTLASLFSDRAEIERAKLKVWTAAAASGRPRRRLAVPADPLDGRALPVAPKNLRYYDLKRYWPRIMPHLDNDRLVGILVRDFNKYTMGIWGEPFTRGRLPCEFDFTGWWLGHRGPEPRFWGYVKSHACHWLVNFYYTLATLAMPKRLWRIITGAHSTVWDGGNLLFEFGYLAFGASPEVCFNNAWTRGKELAPGELLEVDYSEPLAS